MDDPDRKSYPPFSSTEKGECEHCAVTKYCDSRVEGSSFTIMSERERRLKKGHYGPPRSENGEKENRIKRLSMIIAVSVLSVAIFLICVLWLF